MERNPVPLSHAGGSVDYVPQMLALVTAHPTLTWIRPPAPGAAHVAVWQDDDGAQRAERDDLRDLVLYLKAKLGRP